MKTICTLILMGLLALAPCRTAVYAVATTMITATSFDPPMTETNVRLLIHGAKPQLEAQLNCSLNADVLYQAYLDGNTVITYLGFDGIKHTYSVSYSGAVGISGLDNI
jgi:hypothetical protein